MAGIRYRSQTEGRTDRYRVIVWREEAASSPSKTSDIREALAKHFDASTPLELFDAIERLPDIAKICVLDSSSNSGMEVRFS